MLMPSLFQRHDGTPINSFFSKGDHTLTFEEREDGSFLRTLTITKGKTSCKFGSSKYETAATTTAAAAATTENADIIALQEQVAALSGSVTAPTKEFVESEVALAMAKLVKEQGALLLAQEGKFQQMNADRVEQEAQLGKAAQALNTQVLALRESLKGVASKIEGVAGASGSSSSNSNGCPNEDGCAPNIVANGADLTLAAASGDVMIESEQCGSISVCELSQSIAALTTAIADFGEL